MSGTAFAQSDLADQVKDALRANKGVAVHDLGKLLLPKGVTELQELARKFRADNVNIHFVTVPQDSGNLQGLTVSVYRDLNMSANDVLILFNGKQIYGETLALKGEAQAFQEAAQDALPSFKLNYAKGLEHFAQSLHDRILQLRAAAAQKTAVERERVAHEQHAAQVRLYELFGFSGTIVLAGVGWVTYRRMKLQAEADRRYRERLAEAEALYQQIALKLPSSAPPALRDEFLALDRELEKNRHRKGAAAESLDPLLERLNAFGQRLPEDLVHDTVIHAFDQKHEQEA